MPQTDNFDDDDDDALQLSCFSLRVASIFTIFYQKRKFLPVAHYNPLTVLNKGATV